MVRYQLNIKERGYFMKNYNCYAMIKDVKNLVVVGFPGIGTTEFADKMYKIDDLNVHDIELSSSVWMRDDYDSDKYLPIGYINKIKHLVALNEYNIIFVSCYEHVRKALDAANIPFVVMYPDKSLKDIYLERYKESEDDKLLKVMTDKFEKFIDDIDNEEYKNGVKLKIKNNVLNHINTHYIVAANVLLDAHKMTCETVDDADDNKTFIIVSPVRSLIERIPKVYPNEACIVKDKELNAIPGIIYDHKYKMICIYTMDDRTLHTLEEMKLHHIVLCPIKDDKHLELFKPTTPSLFIRMSFVARAEYRIPYTHTFRLNMMDILRDDATLEYDVDPSLLKNKLEDIMEKCMLCNVYQKNVDVDTTDTKLYTVTNPNDPHEKLTFTDHEFNVIKSTSRVRFSTSECDSDDITSVINYHCLKIHNSPIPNLHISHVEDDIIGMAVLFRAIMEVKDLSLENARVFYETCPNIYNETDILNAMSHKTCHDVFQIAYIIKSYFKNYRSFSSEMVLASVRTQHKVLSAICEYIADVIDNNIRYFIKHRINRMSFGDFANLPVFNKTTCLNKPGYILMNTISKLRLAEYEVRLIDTSRITNYDISVHADENGYIVSIHNTRDDECVFSIIKSIKD